MNKFKFMLQRFDEDIEVIDSEESLVLIENSPNISNEKNNTLISGSDYRKYIENSGNQVTIDSGNGNDTVTNTGIIVTINAGDGNNKISNDGSNVTIVSGEGKDTVENKANTAYVATGGGNDTIRNHGDYVTITAGEGNDTVYNGYSRSSGTGSSISIDLGDGDNEVQSNGDNVTIIAGAGNDSVYNNYGHRAVIKTGAGADSIYSNGGEYMTITAGEGDDTVKGHHVSKSTISGGTGNDQISLGSDTENMTVEYTYGDGNDVIYGFHSDDTLQITTPVSYSTMNSDNTLYFIFDNGSIALNNAGSWFDNSNLVTISSATIEDTTPAETPVDTTPSGGTTNIYNGPVINIYGNLDITTVITMIKNNFTSFGGGSSKTIDNFVSGTAENSNGLYFSTALSSISRTSSSMTFNAADGTYLQVNNSSTVDEAIQFTTDGQNVSYAKVGHTNESNSFTYQDGINFYAGSSSTDVLNVTQTEGKNIWLSGMYGGVLYDNVNNVNASDSTGNNTLAGDSNSNQITAGSGNDSLWGDKGNDTLIGGSGQNMFWYGKNDGADVVRDAKSNDTVFLYDINLSDIVSANVSKGIISLGLNTGGQLKVYSPDTLSSTFRLADNTNWKYNHVDNYWQQA